MTLAALEREQRLIDGLCRWRLNNPGDYDRLETWLEFNQPFLIRGALVIEMPDYKTEDFIE